ncbi:MAG TPA: hypothetical protein VGO91_07905 [Pyrinomonadaceae bacterium]|jgi:hypothetical protein|nr:hypothetical protein [Pyrinomonadaceae bacterium]
MYALSASELLEAWERGLGQQPIERALTLLAAACPDTPTDALARLSIGQRDAHLLSIREWLFGPTLVSLVNCPNCGDRLELNFNVADIRVPLEGQPPASMSLSVAGYEVQFRHPNSLDLSAVTRGQDVLNGRRLLLERCLLHVALDEEAKTIDELPSEVIESVVEQMAQADPQADVQLALSCPQCKHQWRAAFDILSFFWSELNVWATRILREVHTLASAYGWCEADILAMSPWRRQMYLEMVSG